MEGTMNGKRAKVLRRVAEHLGISLKDIKRIDNKLNHKEKGVYSANSIRSTLQ